MNLREEQQYMLGLLKNDTQDERIDGVLMEKLGLQRKIIVWWRCFQFEHWLILTAKLLKDQGLLESLVSNFYQQQNIPSYPAEAGEQFVEYILQQPISSLIKSAARLELALIKLKDPDHEKEYRIHWNTSPFPFLDALLKGREYVLEEEKNVSFEMVVSNQISGKMVVHALA